MVGYGKSLACWSIPTHLLVGTSIANQKVVLNKKDAKSNTSSNVVLFINAGAYI